MLGCSKRRVCTKPLFDRLFGRLIADDPLTTFSLLAAREWDRTGMRDVDDEY